MCQEQHSTTKQLLCGSVFTNPFSSAYKPVSLLVLQFGVGSLFLHGFFSNILYVLCVLSFDESNYSQL